MKATLYLLVIFCTLFFSLAVAQTNSNSTVTDSSTEPDNNATVIAGCLYKCSKRGACIDDLYCICSDGFFGYGCEESVYDSHPTAFQAVRFFLMTVYFIMMILALLILIKIFLEPNYLSTIAGKIAFTVISTYFVYELLTALFFAIDPFGVFYSIPFIITLLLKCFGGIMGFIFLGAILFHWMEVCSVAFARLKQDEMLKKINKNYTGTATVEDIMSRVNKMTRLKLPFVGTVLLLTILAVTVQVLGAVHHPAQSTVSLLYLSVIILLYGLLCIGFLVYGRKLIGLMPPSIAKDIRIITMKVTIFCVVTFVCLIIYTVWAFVWFGPVSLLVKECVIGFQQWPLTIMIYSIYTDFNPKNFILTIKKYYSSSSRRSKANTGSAHVSEFSLDSSSNTDANSNV